MHISIVSKKSTWYTTQLLDAAKKNGISASVVNIHKSSDTEGLGDVIYWRSASIESCFPDMSERSVLLTNALHKKKIIINNALVTNPYLTHKSYQQEFLRTHTKKIRTIPTYTAADQEGLHDLIACGKICFPFIAKPDHGSQGNGVLLIKTYDDISSIKKITHYIFQNYIQNSGDYRIYMIGSMPVEIIERTAKDGSFLNNASQGGSVMRVQDSAKRQELANIATHITTIFDLSICGIDIIYNTKDNHYYFLEVNTVAQWHGLQSVSPINIAEKIITYCQDLHNSAKHKPTPRSIENYYTKNASFLSSKKRFHIFSRLYLHHQKKFYQNEIEVCKSQNFWSQETVKNEIDSLYKEKKYFVESMHNGKDFRLPFIARYPKIGLYDHILFKTLFNATIYGNDIRKNVRNAIDINELLDYHTQLSTDTQAIFALSSHAVNMLYLTHWLLEDEKLSVDPQDIFSIGQKISLPSRKDTLLSQIYLFTHAIISASHYYALPIKNHITTYLKMLVFLEKIIIENYTTINLDQKLEFLTCARILQYESILKQTILQESQLSCSRHGHYLIDTLNEHASHDSYKNFSSSEHRNVLFILAFGEPLKRNDTPNAI